MIQTILANYLQVSEQGKECYIHKSASLNH